MITMRVSFVLTVVLLGVVPLASLVSAEEAAPAPDPAAIRIQRTDDGRSILSFPVRIPRGPDIDDSLRATFEFADTKGLDETPVVNKDQSLIAVTNYPATKTAHVYLFIRQPNGDVTAVNSFNQRAAKLLKGRWAKAAESHLQAKSISGRIMQLQAFDYVKGNDGEEYLFKVSVGPDGTLTLAR